MGQPLPLPKMRSSVMTVDAVAGRLRHGFAPYSHKILAATSGVPTFEDCRQRMRILMYHPASEGVFLMPLTLNLRQGHGHAASALTLQTY